MKMEKNTSKCINQKQWYEIKLMKVKVCFVYKLSRTFSLNPPPPPFCLINWRDRISFQLLRQTEMYSTAHTEASCAARAALHLIFWEMHYASKRLSLFFFLPPICPSWTTLLPSVTVQYKRPPFLLRLFSAAVGYLMQITTSQMIVRPNDEATQ